MKFAAYFFYLIIGLLPFLYRDIPMHGLTRLLLLILLAFILRRLIKLGFVQVKIILAVLAGSAVLQSLIGVWQFLKQGSVGLAKFGEPLLGSDIPGIAKIVVDGARIVRAYGTFSHPNIFAAFLLLGLCALFYFWLNRPSEYKIFSGWKTLRSDLIIGLGIFSVVTGLALSFSRAGWLAASIVSLLVIANGLITKQNFRQSVRLLILLSAMCAILLLTLSPYIFARATIDQDEPAYALRAVYNRIGLEIIREKPLGVGIGNQVFYAKEASLYQKYGLTEEWQFQPIHNIYLLVFAEMGIVGGALFLIFITLLIFGHSERSEESQGSFAPLRMTAARAMLSLLLLLGLFDHFLWTTQQGQLMLWLTIGLVLGLNGAEKRS